MLPPLFIPFCDMNIRFNKVLVVVAHPDDEILGCGGLMAKFSSDVEFHILFVAEGSSCRFDIFDSFEAQQAIHERNKSAVKALRALGAKSWHFHNFPCGRLDQTPLIEINKVIEYHISLVEPDVLITHSPCDSNQDHVKICRSSIIASRPYRSPVKAILTCEIPSSTEWGFLETFHPSVCFELSRDQLQMKYQALSFYESELRPFPFPRSFEGLESLAKVRGMQFGFDLGEAFGLLRGSF